MKDSPISKLTITRTGHWATQYKNVIDTLPVLFPDKNYHRKDLVKVDFTPTYPDTNLWSNIYNVEITTVDPNAVLLANVKRTQSIALEQQKHILNTSIQKQLLLKFN